MAALLGPLPDTPTTATPPPPAGSSATRALLADPTVRTVLAVTLVYYLAYGPLEPALPLYSRDVLHAGPSGYGLLWSAFGAGALLGLATVPIVRRLRPGLALAGNSLLWGTTLLPLLLITDTIPAMLILALGGLVWAPYLTLEASLLQRVIPAALLGRVFGTRRAVTAAATPLGAASGGLLLDKASPTTVIGLSALACMLAGAAALCSPALHRLPARHHHPGPDAARHQTQHDKQHEQAHVINLEHEHQHRFSTQIHECWGTEAVASTNNPPKLRNTLHK
jgi:MFS family permease